jgi:non-heme chloroperoxidase
MNTLKINGVNLACDERGIGENLVLVHGAVGNFRTWESTMASFSAQFKTLTYSRRWHFPQALTDTASYSVAVHVGDLIALLESRGPAHLVGHSYGGTICAVTALHRPDLVQSLTLADPALFSLLGRDSAGQAVMSQAAAATPRVVALLRQGKKEASLREFLGIILGPNGFERLPEAARAVMFDNMHTLESMLVGMNAEPPFTSEHAAQIAVPTLLLEGQESPALFRLVVQAMVSALPESHRRTLAGVSHGLHLENPDRFSRTVLQFLSSVQGGKSPAMPGLSPGRLKRCGVAVPGGITQL